MEKNLITAKQIVSKFHISFQTVNHYTNFGLLSIVARKGNVRLYNEAEVKQRLALISELANEGYSLYLIRKKLLGI